MVFEVLQGLFTQKASCFEGSKELNSHLRKADPKELKEIFLKHASVYKNGERYMTDNDLVNGYLRLPQNENYNQYSKLLEGIFATSKDGLISFPEFQSFEEQQLLPKAIYRTAFQESDTKGKGKVSQNEFQQYAHEVSQIATTEVLFKLCQSSNQRGKLAEGDLHSTAPEDTQAILRPVLLSNKDVDEVKSNNKYWIWKGEKKEDSKEVVNLEQKEMDSRSFLMSVLESFYRLVLGFIGGGTGAAAVYPIDLVKTRMQNQRINLVTGERMYNHSFDCFYKVLKNEGPRGLYRGLIPQILGVAPEKAAKLTVNDFLRDKLKTSDGNIPLWAEIFSGAMGGAAQVTFSCPVEIIKIQLQMAGEVKGGPVPRAIDVLKEKFLFGLYKGGTATYCRDMTFAGIYFPTYSNVKKMLIDEHGYNQPHTLFLSGILAGIPAASLATPFDVIKTRLQVKPREGQTTYSGFRDAVRKVWREEGWTAFWKGAGARVCRSSPQLAVTLVTYELLQRLLYIDFGGRRPEGSEKKSSEPKKVSYNPNQIGGYQTAIPIITGVETQFGISLPKFNIVPISTSDIKPKDEPED